jgi:hypothetical protein
MLLSFNPDPIADEEHLEILKSSLDTWASLRPEGIDLMLSLDGLEGSLIVQRGQIIQSLAEQTAPARPRPGTRRFRGSPGPG